MTINSPGLEKLGTKGTVSELTRTLKNSPGRAIAKVTKEGKVGTNRQQLALRSWEVNWDKTPG